MSCRKVHVHKWMLPCRLLAGIQAKQDMALSKDARSKQVKLQQQRQKHGSKRFQANQDGPGDLRPDGQRYELQAWQDVKCTCASLPH